MEKHSFFDESLLQTNYFQKYQRAYEKTKGTPYHNQNRNYSNLVNIFDAIYQFDEQHAKAFAKRIKSQDNDWKTCEAVFTELLIYYFYLKLYYEGLVKSLHIQESECDLIVERSDGTKMYIEAFCVMPDFPIGKPDNPIVYDVKTHTQEALSSIRQKLLHKIHNQKQLTKLRENYAVIELNDVSIAGDFSVLSSLSDGYKVTIDKNTMEITNSYYDWSNSVFDDPATTNLKAIIYFSLGSYETRKIIINPNFNA